MDVFYLIKIDLLIAIWGQFDKDINFILRYESVLCGHAYVVEQSASDSEKCHFRYYFQEDSQNIAVFMNLLCHSTVF